MSKQDKTTLPFVENKGITELSKLSDLNLPLDVLKKVKGILKNDFNEKRGKWKNHPCLGLLVAIMWGDWHRPYTD